MIYFDVFIVKSKSFDFNFSLRITVPERYSGLVNGVCGNFNGDSDDDFVREGVVMQSFEFVSSWKYLPFVTHM